MSHKNKNKGSADTTPADETEASGSSADKFLSVMQKLLEHQQTQLQEERARWVQREEELKWEKEVDRARWEAQQSAQQEERAAERRRADEEWALRLEELRLRTDALKRSEAAVAEALAGTAEREKRDDYRSVLRS